jgi:plastocyanin
MGLAAVLVLAGCSSSTSSEGGGASCTTITVGNDFFSPTPNTVAAGEVTFTWSTPSNGHTLIWDSGPGTLPANTVILTSGSRTVTLQPGVYEYHCSLHGSASSGMRGSIIVE